jgi:hypothetical protein
LVDARIPRTFSPQPNSVRVYRRSESTDRFDQPVELWLDEGDTLTTPLLPGIKLPLAAIFKE